MQGGVRGFRCCWLVLPLLLLSLLLLLQQRPVRVLLLLSLLLQAAAADALTKHCEPVSIAARHLRLLHLPRHHLLLHLLQLSPMGP